jgi:hypothetical protein
MHLVIFVFLPPHGVAEPLLNLLLLCFRLVSPGTRKVSGLMFRVAPHHILLKWPSSLVELSTEVHT